MTTTSDGTAQDAMPLSWRRFIALVVGVSLGLGLAVVAFVAAMDPYGLHAAAGRRAGPLMDSNQRFMYPQVVRSGAYDAAVFGTSTARLLDPVDLDRTFGGHFANLAMNAATPFEQVEMARLFLRHASPRTILWGLDRNWCEADADTRRFTFRPFPSWLYTEGTPLGALRQVNWQSLAAASAVLLHRVGKAPVRLRGDGYAVFTPPEASYDAARAALHIHGGRTALPDAAGDPDSAPRAASDPEAMPALAWLDDTLAALPPTTAAIVAFMPAHVAAQGAPGTPMATREAACKAHVAEIGRRRGALVVDFRIPSPVTREDTNYWDALHYRLPIAARIVAALGAARAKTADASDGFYSVLSRP
ncbi:hypothetical protein G3T14_07460 [Methylobacterium sp. BTF04]|uniref:hypothetical protein n=1 Tax=Methylobacterium sp. BTF04 TaxID=2708300 RepID=UPI0013D5FFD8|nr:hypothetical protein [Methylobacterium sp. BTF04]NEU11965.1 hypothetical protein [Methylobacterium sp. BTF04]